MHTVHQPCIEGGSEQRPPALDHHARAAAPAKITQHGAQRFAAEDKRAPAMRVGKKMRVLWQASTTREHDAPRLPRLRAAHTAHREPRIVHAHRACAHEDRICLRAQPHRIRA